MYKDEYIEDIKFNRKASEISGQYTRINCALKIFKEKEEYEALNLVINSKVNYEVKILAEKILGNYRR